MLWLRQHLLFRLQFNFESLKLLEMEYYVRSSRCHFFSFFRPRLPKTMSNVGLFGKKGTVLIFIMPELIASLAQWLDCTSAFSTEPMFPYKKLRLLYLDGLRRPRLSLSGGSFILLRILHVTNCYMKYT